MCFKPFSLLKNCLSFQLFAFLFLSLCIALLRCQNLDIFANDESVALLFLSIDYRRFHISSIGTCSVFVYFSLSLPLCASLYNMCRQYDSSERETLPKELNRYSLLFINAQKQWRKKKERMKKGWMKGKRQHHHHPHQNWQNCGRQAQTLWGQYCFSFDRGKLWINLQKGLNNLSRGGEREGDLEKLCKCIG